MPLYGRICRGVLSIAIAACCTPVGALLPHKASSSVAATSASSRPLFKKGTGPVLLSRSLRSVHSSDLGISAAQVPSLALPTGMAADVQGAAPTQFVYSASPAFAPAAATPASPSPASDMAPPMAPAPAPVFTAPLAPWVPPPPVAEADADTVEGALSLAFHGIQAASDQALVRQETILNLTGSEAEQQGAAKVQADANSILEAQNEELTAVATAGIEQEKQKAIETARAEFQKRVIENTKLANQTAIGSVDAATNAAEGHSAAVITKLDDTRRQANTLSDEAKKAAMLGDAAARSAEAWIAELPVEQAKSIASLEGTSLSISLRLQAQAEEASRIDKLVSYMVDETKVAADEAQKIAVNASSISADALRQAIANSRTVKEVKDLATDVQADAGAAMVSASEVENVQSLAAQQQAEAKQAAEEAMQAAQAQ